jgi:thymidine phosphorylase
MDLRQKALRLAGRLIEYDPDVRGGEGFAIARDILDSGRALAQMNAIIKAQGSKQFDHKNPPLGSLVYEVKAPTSGVVVSIDNLQIASIARLAGAPKVPRIDSVCKLGDKVEVGETLYRIHSEIQADFVFAKKLCDKASGYQIGREEEIHHVFVEF